jgi:hypothetical protein
VPNPAPLDVRRDPAFLADCADLSIPGWAIDAVVRAIMVRMQEPSFASQRGGVLILGEVYTPNGPIRRPRVTWTRTGSEITLWALGGS